MAKDNELGMNRAITRRDFMEGVGVALAGSLLPSNLLAAGTAGMNQQAGSYPPAQMGLRGNHTGSFEVAHQLARERRSDWGPAEDPDGVTYDRVIVGAGISGLSAAHFYKKEHPEAKILILDNHDDFGGHAKRNEFISSGGQKLIGYGGSQTLYKPEQFSDVAKTLLDDLKVDLDRFETAFDRGFNKRWGMAEGVYFDRETYGVDQVVHGSLVDYRSVFATHAPTIPVKNMIPQMPISEQAKQQLLSLYSETKDQIPEHWIFGEASYLQSITYENFLTQHMKVTDPQALALLRNVFSDVLTSDAMPALWAMSLGLPGFEATDIGLFKGLINWLGGTNADNYIHHFPDGNASIARLLVRRLVSGIAPGDTMEDVITAPFDYSRLDQAEASVRIRLSSTVVNVRNRGDAKNSQEAEITYVKGGTTFQVRARGCVLACYNRVIPHLCPELPAKQKEALAQLVKLPLVYTNVLLRNWQPWKKLGVSFMYCPGSYHKSAMLDFPVSLGSVKFSSGPDDPIVVHMDRIPSMPGLSLTDQCKAGRLEMLSTRFETIERGIRTQLAGMLGSEGFDPALDIEAITVNRWPHGYAWYDLPTESPDYKDDEIPYVLGRKRFGRISIANSDAGGEALASAAIDQAHRAIGELEE